jgi:hypothetical protein
MIVSSSSVNQNSILASSFSRFYTQPNRSGNEFRITSGEPSEVSELLSDVVSMDFLAPRNKNSDNLQDVRRRCDWPGIASPARGTHAGSCAPSNVW